MRTKLAALALTAGLATGAVALTAPVSAFAAADAATSTATTSPAAGSTAVQRAAARVTAIKDALKGLVTDGTLTQAQADRVATTLSTSDALRGGGHGRHGGGHLSPEAVAKVLGISVDELRTQQQAGKTLAQIADAEGMSKADLVTGLVAAAKAQLAADVTAGRLTQAQADEKAAGLQAETTQRVDQVRPARGDRDRDGDGPAGVASATPSPTA